MRTFCARVGILSFSLLALSGCARYFTPNGTVIGTAPLTWTFPIPALQPVPPRAAPETEVPPGALGIPEGAQPPAADLSGAYSGEAVVTYNPGQISDCTDLAIHGSLMVTGRHARFFAFTGTIAPDGQVVMQAGDKWISGRFIGRKFEGVLLRRFPACSWNLNLAAP
jgi:hypothetical protein